MTTPVTADDVLAALNRIVSLPQHDCDDARNLAALEIAKREAIVARTAVAAAYAERDALLEIAEMTVRNLRHKAEQEGIEPSSLGRFERALYEKAVSALARSKGGAS